MREQIYVVMTTWNRTELAKKCLSSMRDNLVYENLHWHIADDGSREGHVEELMSVLSPYPVTFTDAKRGGVGRSKNLALQYIYNINPNAITLLTEDDWFLDMPKFDLSLYADLLISNPKVGLIRLGYLSHGLSADLVGDVEGYGQMCYWRIKPNSDQYAYSGQISLRSPKWYQTIGYHKEGVNAGQEELDMCGRFNNYPNPPEILWPANLLPHFQMGPFKNIGMDSSTNSVEPEK
jgi:glycosyltransferase involved in cell wall biosynthesis